jgi:hypothetical protein
VTTCDELAAILMDEGLTHSERMRRLKDLTGIEDCVTQALSDAVANQDWDTVELYLLAAFHHPARSMTPILCKALRLRSRAVPNEDALQVLAEIKDSDALDCLREVLYWHPEWDEFDQIGVKALWAIDAIGTDDARKLVAEAAERGSEAVRDWAQSKLNRH